MIIDIDNSATIKKNIINNGCVLGVISRQDKRIKNAAFIKELSK